MKPDLSPAVHALFIPLLMALPLMLLQQKAGGKILNFREVVDANSVQAGPVDMACGARAKRLPPPEKEQACE